MVNDEYHIKALARLGYEVGDLWLQKNRMELASQPTRSGFRVPSVAETADQFFNSWEGPEKPPVFDLDLVSEGRTFRFDASQKEAFKSFVKKAKTTEVTIFELIIQNNTLHGIVFSFPTDSVLRRFRLEGKNFFSWVEEYKRLQREKEEGEVVKAKERERKLTKKKQEEEDLFNDLLHNL